MGVRMPYVFVFSVRRTSRRLLPGGCFEEVASRRLFRWLEEAASRRLLRCFEEAASRRLLRGGWVAPLTASKDVLLGRRASFEPWSYGVSVVGILFLSGVASPTASHEFRLERRASDCIVAHWVQGVS
jgi:hypothetical protein